MERVDRDHNCASIGPEIQQFAYSLSVLDRANRSKNWRFIAVVLWWLVFIVVITFWSLKVVGYWLLVSVQSSTTNSFQRPKSTNDYKYQLPTTIKVQN
ncbi:hypothetical protein BpHYR1_029268 [Brachionus plicatilis]|uniref:Uncharacterized protein n=1 Tax=Brachionus plicatilis TaxID=10195 RepID=A0A3M7QBY6_BRAPC|nr:hypothetical protein BpHYR1_029268 [Brachionus plicatilis]